MIEYMYADHRREDGPARQIDPVTVPRVRRTQGVDTELICTEKDNRE